MKWMLRVAVSILSLDLACGYALAQASATPQSPEPAPAVAASAANPEPGPVVVDWAPPAFEQLSAQAEAKSSFTLDRTMLAATANLISGSDDQVRQAIGRLNGVSVRVLRFGADGIADPAQVDAIRQAYHLRGWKHLVSATSTGGPGHSGTTDVWLVLDGANVRGAVVLVGEPQKPDAGDPGRQSEPPGPAPSARTLRHSALQWQRIAGRPGQLGGWQPPRARGHCPQGNRMNER
jgi:hypothetical protein